jgi:hypothetical protein
VISSVSGVRLYFTDTPTVYAELSCPVLWNQVVP